MIKLLTDFHNQKGGRFGVTSKCKECIRITVGSKKRFEKWTNERFDNLLPEGYLRLGNVDKWDSKVLIKCNNGHITSKRPSDLNSGTFCKDCSILDRANRAKKWNNEFFDIQLRILKPNWIRIGEVVDVLTPVRLFCDNGHENKKAPNDLDGGCTICLNREPWNNKKFDELLPRNLLRLEDVVNSYTPVKIICDNNHTTYKRPHNLLTPYKGCNLCKNSKGEQVICDFLNDNNIKYISEYSFDDCRNKYKLFFDFAILEEEGINRFPVLLIEFDGIQHYEPIHHFGGELSLAETQFRDKIKDEYCKKNKIKLIRIPYWDFDNIENVLRSNLKFN